MLWLLVRPLPPFSDFIKTMPTFPALKTVPIRRLLRAKAAQNSVATATKNLNKAIDQYGRGSKEAQAAQAKLTVAQERAINKTESAKIAQDNLNQTMADFGINILPNLILAGGGVTEMLNTMGGTKGLGGLIPKFKGLGAGITGALSGIGGLTGGISGLTAVLGPLALVIGAAALAWESYNEAMANVAKGNKELELAKNAKLLTDQIAHLKKAFDDFKIDPKKGPAQFIATLGPAPAILNKVLDVMKDEAVQTAKNTAESKKLIKAKQDLAVAEKNYQNAPRKDKEHTKDIRDQAAAEVTRLQKIEDAIPATEKLTARQQALNAEAVKLTNTWALQIHAFEGSTTSINLATKAYLDVHNAIVASNPDIQKNIEQTRLQKQETDALAVAQKNVKAAEDPASLRAYNNSLKGGTSFITLFGNRTDIAKEAMDKFNQKTSETSTGMDSFNRALQDGVDQAHDFIPQMELAAVTEEAFNTTLADSAKNLGIHTNLLAFSSTKMQELIKTTYEQTTAFNAMQVAAAKSTAFLKDQTLIQAQVNSGMLDGTIAANDWAISNVKATAESKAFHDQLLKITEDMTGLAIPAGTTNEALQKMQTTFLETKDAGLAMAQMMTDKLTPAFERMSSIIGSKDMKELHDNLKKMELPPGFKHGLEDAFKPLRGAAEEGRQLGNAMDILVTAGENMSKKDLAKNMKAFGKELDRISKIKGTSAPVDAILMSLKTMSPAELGNHTKSMAFLAQTLDKYGSLPKDKAQEFITMFNNETPKMGSAAETAAPKVDKLTASLKAFATEELNRGKASPLTLSFLTGGLNQPTTPAGPTTQKTIITADNTQAIKAVDVVAKRILGLSTINPKINVDNAPAIKKIDQIVKRLMDLTGINPKIPVDNAPAIKKIDQIVKRIQGLSDINPKIPVDNAPAIKKIDQIAKRIQGLSKINPEIVVKNDKALKAIDAIAKRITSLPSGNVTVKVNYDTSGKPAGVKAQHGFHGTLSETTTILAHKGERVDIGQASSSSGMTRAGGGGGGGGGDNFFFNIHFGDKEIVKRVKAELGRSVYTMGA